MLAGGCWRDLPERFGPYQTAKRRYYRWIAAVCSNSCWILREDRPFARRTKSLTEMYGGISTNIWTWSRDSRSEEHTSELQSLMRISYDVFCLKKQKHKIQKYERH